MANVKTFNLSVYLPTKKTDEKTVKEHWVTFRGISRVAVERYKKYYHSKYYDIALFVEERK